MHTHPGIGRRAAFPSEADASSHLIHRQGGGKGALEVISRLENGGTFTMQWNYAEAKEFLDDLEDYLRILSWGN